MIQSAMLVTDLRVGLVEAYMAGVGIGGLMAAMMAQCCQPGVPVSFLSSWWFLQ